MINKEISLLKSAALSILTVFCFGLYLLREVYFFDASNANLTIETILPMALRSGVFILFNWVVALGVGWYCFRACNKDHSVKE